MVAHLEYAIGVLCLGGVAAVAVHTIIETLGPNWRKIRMALNGTDLQEPIAGASCVESRKVGDARHTRRDKQQNGPADHDDEIHTIPSTPLTAPWSGLELVGADAGLGSSIKLGRINFPAGCVVSASQVRL